MADNDKTTDIAKTEESDSLSYTDRAAYTDRVDYCDRVQVYLDNNPKWTPILSPIAYATGGIVEGMDVFVESLNEVNDDTDILNGIGLYAGIGGFVGAIWAATVLMGWGIVPAVFVGIAGARAGYKVTPLALASVIGTGAAVVCTMVNIIDAPKAAYNYIKKRINYNREQRALRAVASAKALAEAVDTETVIEGVTLCGSKRDMNVIRRNLRDLENTFGQKLNQEKYSAYRPIAEGSLAPIFAAVARFNSEENSNSFANNVIKSINQLQASFSKVKIRIGSDFTPLGDNVPFVKKVSRIKSEANAYIAANS